MKSLRLFVLPLAVVVFGVGSSAVAGAAVAHHGKVTCHGGTIAAGTYKSLRVTGACTLVASGNVTVKHNVVVTGTGLFNAGTPATLRVGGDVIVQHHGATAIGCSPDIGCAALGADVIHGDLRARGAAATIVHGTTIWGNASIRGGGRTEDCSVIALNTILVSVIGIFFATILGFIVALGRLSPNWLMSRVAGAYVELVRNLPLLFQMLFWYLAVLAALPAPRQSISPVSGFFLNNRGVIVPTPVGAARARLFCVRGPARDRRLGRSCTAMRAAQLYQRGHCHQDLALCARPLHRPAAPDRAGVRRAVVVRMAGPERLQLRRRLAVIPEFVALALALTIYTAAFIAEIVRAGILAVHKGQMEAGLSLGLSRGSVLRLIVVPQALRVILPPLTNQYLNLTKNSSLAVAIGYPDLVSVFAGTALSQTGQAIEIIAITMGVYLAAVARHQRDHEFLRMAARPEHGRMSDVAAHSFVRAGAGRRARRAGEDDGLCRLPAHAAVQLADQHPAHDRWARC